MKKNHSLLWGISILPALLVMPAMAETITERQVINDSRDFTDVEASVQGTEYGGAMFIQMTDPTSVVNISGQSSFSLNEALPDTGYACGGAIALYTGVLNIDGAEFTNNEATYYGAIYAKGGSTTTNNTLNIKNSIFSYNQAQGTGAVGLLRKGLIENTKFDHNMATQDEDGAGALFFGAVSEGTVKDSTFTYNESVTRGGAIATRGTIGDNTAAKVDIINSTFSHNTAGTTGGAIDNYLYNNNANEAAVNVSGAKFSQNNAASGGAIYNHPELDLAGNKASMNVSGSTFALNEATDNGGAIYNGGTMTVVDGVFSGNKAKGTYTPNSQNTYANYADGKGGAIFNSGTLTVGGTFRNNTAFHGGAVYNNGTLTVSDGSNFDGNYANVEGGAIANYGNLTIGDNVTFNNNRAFIQEGDLDVTSGGSEMGAVIYSEGTGATRTVNIGDNVKFTNNYSPFGNVYFLNSNNVTIGDNVEFSGNSSEKAAGIRTSSTGAGNSTITIGDNARFVNNTVTSATGAAAIRLYDDSVTIGKNAVFLDNTGTAVYNGNSDITFGSNVTFSGNNANAAEGIGGALVNHGVAVATFDGGLFANNTATLAGGAIYNKAGATVNLNATSGDLVFTGNTANGVANDIYNLGVVNVLSGTTTMDGGIDGTGALTIADGATLNMGVASIVQNTVNLNGTLNATLLNANKYAYFDVETFNVSENGSLNLSLKGVGEYEVFRDDVIDADVSFDSNLYDIAWNDAGDTITVSLRPVDDIIADTGLDKEAGAVITSVAMAASSSDSAQMQDMSLRLQDALASGDTASVEHAAKAIHPETESVVQSVSSSVQSTVTSLAASRMSMPSVGRNGGDVKMTSGGVWAQGIFNKSKQNDSFNGYTRGVGVGLDGTINKAWTIGAGYTFAHSDIAAKSRDTEIDSSSVFVYGQYKPTQWYANAVLNYTMSDYSEKGSALGVGITADYDVDSFGANVATGYDFAGGITPELALRYMHVDASEYSNSLGVAHKFDSSDYLTAALSTKYAFDVKASKNLTLRPELRYGVKYDIVSDKQMATVTMPGVNAYTLDGERLSRIGGEFGIGMGMNYKGFDLSLNYDIEAREDYTSQSGRVKFRYNF